MVIFGRLDREPARLVAFITIRVRNRAVAAILLALLNGANAGRRAVGGHRQKEEGEDLDPRHFDSEDDQRVLGAG